MSKKTTGDDDVVLVCARIIDVPDAHVPSLPRICDLCGYRVWISVRAPTVDRIWCQPCATGEMRSDDKVGFAEETVEEIEDYLKGRLS
jgi:hypothetical protein